MSNRKKELDKFLSKQETLFDDGISEGALDVDMAFREVLSRLIRHHRESRYQIVAKISELTTRNISKDMLDKYTSSNKDYSPRITDLPAICAVFKSIEPAQVLLAPIGCEVITQEEGNLIRIARLEKQRNEIDAMIAELKHRTGIKG